MFPGSAQHMPVGGWVLTCPPPTSATRGGHVPLRKSLLLQALVPSPPPVRHPAALQGIGHFDSPGRILVQSHISCQLPEA